MEGRERRYCIVVLVLLALALMAAAPSFAQISFSYNEGELQLAFAGAQTVDLRTCKVYSVVKLRDFVGIPPSAETVFVKTFKEDALPVVLERAFADPNVRAVTIGGRYIAILQTRYPKEYNDTLAHELVHAYITLASPKQLNFTFQEASAVHFSIDKDRKFYGKPSDKIGVTEGHVVELSPEYKQKLHFFQNLISKVGEKKFYAWYKNAVLTGDTSPRPLLGLDSKSVPANNRKPLPIWVWAIAAAVAIAAMLIGYIAMRRQEDDLY